METNRSHPDVQVGDRILFPVRRTRDDLGHEIGVNGVTMRIFTFTQLEGCVVLEPGPQADASGDQA